MRLLNASLLVLLAALTNSQDRPLLRGRVVADQDGTPIRNARVTIASEATGSPVVLTDGDGRFAVPAPASAARVVVSKTGYGRVEVTAAGDALEVRLPRAAVITGRVTDGSGEPIEGARVVAQNAPAVDNAASVAAVNTDDRGEYRLAGLAPGSYIVSAIVSGPMVPQRIGDGIALIPRADRIFFPDASHAAEASPLALGAGEDRSRIDFVAPNGRSLGQVAIITTPGPTTRPPSAKNGERSTAIVRGRVVSADGAGIAHADVRLQSANERNESINTRADAAGAFEFRDLPPGRFMLAAAKVGFQLSASLPAVSVAENQVVDRVDVPLRRWGAITGRILDEYGDAIHNAMVQPLQIHFERGRRRLIAVGPSAVSDDLGRYRIRNLAAGGYVVSATVGEVGSAELPGYVRGFYPGTPNAGQAQFVRISDGQELSSIDLGLTRSRTARVSGRLLDSSGKPTMGGNVVLLPAQSSSSVTFVGAGARLTQDGGFEFANVADGQYVIQVSRGRSNTFAEGEFAAMPVTVNGTDVTGLTIQTSAGSSVRGRVTFDTRDPSKAPSQRAVELTLIPADPDTSPTSVASANIHDDWTFDMRGINGSRRLTLTRTPEDWTVSRIRVNGIDATDRALTFGRTDQSLNDVEVVLTDRVSEVTGTLPDVGKSIAAVVVFATDQSRWYAGSRFLRMTSVRDNAFRIVGLPFGTYYLAAVNALPTEGEDAWQSAEFLETLSRQAEIVTIRDGEKTMVRINR